MTPKSLCYIVALICFVVAALPIKTNGGINFTNLGYAALTASLLVT